MAVYEIRDTTDELEGYESLGIYDDLELAKETVNKGDEPINTDIYGTETIQIYERELNKFTQPKLVFTIERVERYCEEKDDYIWKIKELHLCK